MVGITERGKSRKVTKSKARLEESQFRMIDDSIQTFKFELETDGSVSIDVNKTGNIPPFVLFYSTKSNDVKQEE